jgi:hypothetical protein
MRVLPVTSMLGVVRRRNEVVDVLVVLVVVVVRYVPCGEVVNMCPTDAELSEMWKALEALVVTSSTIRARNFSIVSSHAC